MKLCKISAAIIGIILFCLSIWFWHRYGLVYETRQFPPPITTVVIWIGFFTMLFLMYNGKRVELIFGKKPESQRNILHILGAIFTAFILMITLLWSLNPLNLHPNVLYDQSYLLIGLFFYITFAFYCILADLKK